MLYLIIFLVHLNSSFKSQVYKYLMKLSCLLYKSTFTKLSKFNGEFITTGKTTLVR